MISHVVVSGWKAYSELSVDLKKGTTFIVAHNGVGKTSFMQAVEWCLTGALRGTPPDATFIRNGSDSATVAIVVQSSSGRTTKIERSIRRETRDKTSETIRVDGDATKGDPWLSNWLQSEFGFDQSTLSRLCFLPEGEVVSAVASPDASFNVVDFVSELFGASALGLHAERLEQFSSREQRRADKIRRSSINGGSEQLKSIVRKLAELEAELQEVMPAVEALKKRVEERREFDRQAGAARHLEEVLEAAEVRTVATLSELGYELSSIGDAQIALQILDATQADLQDQESLAGAELGDLKAQLGAIDRSVELLDQESESCPTCRRPFEAAEADSIRLELLALRQGVASRVSELERVHQSVSDTLEDTVMKAKALRADVAEFESLTRQIELLRRIPEPEVDLSLYRELSGRVVELEARRSSLEGERSDLAASIGANEEAVRIYRDAYKARLAAATMDAAKREIFQTRVDPLAVELANRWKEVWPSDATLELPPSGDLEIVRSGGRIAVTGFSGGERAVAVVLLRLLAAQMAGRSPFMWFDEPLEHLDGRNRRLLATMLSSAAASGAVGQVVVTTYEDSVTRRLGERYGEGDRGCRTVYVRSGNGA
jgi:DNA repair exonuclease SbcCD ATPase subunit